MPSAFSGNAAFWRGCCLVVALIAAIEAFGLVLVTRTSSAPHPAAVSDAARKSPDAVAATPAVTGETVAHPRVPASSRKHALAATDPRHRTREWEDRGISLAEKDPETALRALADLAPGADRNAMTRGVFEVLARGDAAQAITDAKQTRPGLEREAALTALLEGWNGPANDDTPSERARRIASDGLEAGLGLELLSQDSPRPDLAVLWAQELTSDKGKADLLTAAATVQVRTDPALAASYGSGLAGKEQLLFNSNLVSAWSRLQPEAAWQWSSALTDPAVRSQAQNSVVIAQSITDLPGAIDRMALLPDDDQRIETLKDLAVSYAEKNTDAATAWAQTLPPADRLVASEAISAVTPVGAGLMMGEDEGGYAVVRELVPNLGAAQSGAIHEGDRIVAVSQGNNQFVDVQTLELTKVTDLIRGPAGSMVQLQVTPALPGGGFGPPTVVSVVRQQIKHGG